jgi:hypothetical protein
LNGLRMGVVSASSEESSRSGLEEDSRELARFAKVIDDTTVRVSPQDERLAAATATIARLQPTVARFDTLFLQVSFACFVWGWFFFCCGLLRFTLDADAALGGHDGGQAGCAAAAAHAAA